MRLLGSVSDESKAREFSYFLLREGIDNHVEPQGTADSGPIEYLLWVHDEDKMPQALTWMEAFSQDNDNPLFYGHYQFVKHLRPTPPTQQAEPMKSIKIHAPQRRLPRRPPAGPVTLTVLLLCAFIFGVMAFSPKPAVNDLKGHYEGPAWRIYSTLLFDLSARDEMLQELYRTYPAKVLIKPEQLPEAGRALYQKAVNTPEWPGAYAYLLSWATSGPTPTSSTPRLFEKIRSGEAWRLFTPCLLHGNFLHIFFNMLWLIVLGPILESRLGWSRYLVLILATGVFSNSAQYLMGGPDFVGYSGVITAMAGFIWIRQKKAPWESYLVHPSTFKFLAFMVLMMTALQVFSFLSAVYGANGMRVGIANTAHIAGGLSGIFLGRLSWFASR